MFIFVGCAGGGTSSMFCQRIAKAINATDPNLTAAFGGVNEVLADPIACIGDHDLMFAYGSIDVVRGYSAFDFGQLFDAILVAPQVKYLTVTKQKIMANYPTIVEDIPSEIFGKMNGEVAFEELRGELIMLDLLRGYQSSLQTASKNADKDIEILVLNADHRNQQLAKVFANWQRYGIRVLTETYTLEGLYQFDPPVDFELRLLFGATMQLNQQDFVRISRRIDGLIIFSETPKTAFRDWRQQLDDADIPTAILDARMLEKRADVTQLSAELTDFIQTVEFQAEATAGQIRLPKLQTKKAKKQHTLFGIISWNSTIK